MNGSVLVFIDDVEIMTIFKRKGALILVHGFHQQALQPFSPKKFSQYWKIHPITDMLLIIREYNIHFETISSNSKTFPSLIECINVI